jgi:hypothetical protein
MLKKMLMSAFVLSVSTASVLSADPTETQIVGATVSGNQISVSLHNPDASPDTARVQVSVGLADGTIRTLVTGNVTLEGGGTTSVWLTASDAIVAIIEDPQPISPAY